MDRTELRAAFAVRMAEIYGGEVPAYRTLVEQCQAINTAVARERGVAIERVTVERHGAIRLGTVAELRAAALVFAALGMSPVGFYDLREAGAEAAVPVVSTAFRPTDPDELARNPFRMFTSLLVPEDRRFFDDDLSARVRTFLGRRSLFGPELLGLAARAVDGDGLDGPDAPAFLAAATAVFALSREPVELGWYRELEQVSSVAADIAGVAGTHLNHLTPRVLDIDLLQRRMTGRGIEMIPRIQGPPRWDGPEVLLRQTSFRALDEPRRFRTADGSVVDGALRVRFGEVEARGMALTRAGRERYDAAIADPAADWAAYFPRTEAEMVAGGLGYATFAVADAAAARPGMGVADLLAAGALTHRPIVYEDFLPRSAAGIFQSNLTSGGRRDDSASSAPRDADWLAGALERPVADPFDLYAAQSAASLRATGLAE
jgi:uncharacterized glyoxalase superfamily metalloenzyme YdcJ